MTDMPSRPTPHLSKLDAAERNGKCTEQDRNLLGEAKNAYHRWIAELNGAAGSGREKVDHLVASLNRYKDLLEVDLIAKRGSPFIKRQKGQMKLDNSVLEEFLPYLLDPDIVPGIDAANFVTGPQKAFMSLAFMPEGFQTLGRIPNVVIKSKDQDFTIATPIHYQLSSSPGFATSDIASGSFALAVLAAELKVNLDKTMFQEAAGTAHRLKQGCPIAKYFLVAEYLDMTPEDPRITEIDNVFLLRKTKRLPFERRAVAEEVEKQHKQFPIASDVIWKIVGEIQSLVQSAWYDKEAAINRGSFLEQLAWSCSGL